MSTHDSTQSKADGFCGRTLTLKSSEKDIGAFSVRRILPAAECQMVGPFIFFDHFGPVDLPPGKGIDVRPHPHIGIATLTYLFDGEIFHRDSLGNALPISPGAVNWMTAGRGIVHSERERPEVTQSTHHLHGIQSWIALPKDHEEDEPAFFHHKAEELPVFEQGGAQLRLIIGEAYGHKSPVKTYSEMFYLGVEAPAGAEFSLPAGFAERAVYVASGAIDVDGQAVGAHEMHVVATDSSGAISVREPAHLMLLGGAPMDGPRHIWWNFVSSSKERIEQAAQEWKNGDFPSVPGDEEEFIPLPAR